MSAFNSLPLYDHQMPDGAPELLKRIAGQRIAGQRIAGQHIAGQHIAGQRSGNDGQSQIDLSTELANWLIKHGLHLLVYERIALNAQSKTVLQPHIALAIANCEIQTNALDQLLSAIDAAKLSKPVVFKGSALMHWVYSKPWYRPKTDHDLLIPHGQREAYHNLFITLGFTHTPNNAGQFTSYQSSYGQMLVGQTYLNIDVHWRTSNRQLLANLFGIEELTKHSIEIRNGMRVPNRAYSIALSATHIIGHHLGNERLVWFYDLYLLGLSSSTSDFEDLVSLVDKKRIAGIVLAALEATEALFTPLLPVHTRKTLMTLAMRTESTQALLTKPHLRWRLIYWDLKAIPSWQDKLKFIIENILPSPDYLRGEFNTNNLWIAHWRRIKRRILKF